jgi:hypothetical protein
MLKASLTCAAKGCLDTSLVRLHISTQQREGNTMRFYILLRDECGDTFGVTMYAESLDDCLDLLDEEYPESSVVDVHQVNMGF